MPKEIAEDALYGSNELTVDVQLQCHLLGVDREHAWGDRHVDDVVQIGEPNVNRKGCDLTDDAMAFKLDAVAFVEVGHLLLTFHLRLHDKCAGAPLANGYLISSS